MAQRTFLQQIGIGVASLTFGVALSIFIYAAASGLVSGVSAWLLYVTSFLLMLRFWWRYSELFIRYLPSSSFWHFLLDFAIAFFGISAVLFVSNIQMWALISAAAMAASIVRCALSWPAAKSIEVKQKLRRTIAGALFVIVVMAAAYLLVPVVDAIQLAAAILVLTVIFVAYSAARK